MAVSTHSQDALVAGGGKDNDGGVIANGGTIAGSKYTTKLLTDINIGRDESGSKVVATAGSASRPGIQAAFVSGGTLAYNPNARAVTRSSSDTGFLIRGGTFTKLSGKASTEHFLSRPGSDEPRRRVETFTTVKILVSLVRGQLRSLISLVEHCYKVMVRLKLVSPVEVPTVTLLIRSPLVVQRNLLIAL